MNPPQGLWVRAKQHAGFRRAGRFFSYEGTQLPLSSLTPQVYALLINEPKLTRLQGDLDKPTERQNASTAQNAL